ncbi:MAG: relaxase domain-containing protein [Geothrix sp.]|nr:relaxase domain-containing protein [Geothrix sp.]
MREAGVLQFVKNYLNDEHKPRFEFLDEDHWRALGLSEEELQQGRLDLETIRNLLRGCDCQGRRLVREVRGGFHRMVHGLWTHHPVVSHLLAELGEELHVQELQAAIAQCWYDSLASMATRRSSGGREIKHKDRIRIEPGKILMGWVSHGLNKLGEPHLHGHPFAFIPVYCLDDEWRALEVGPHGSWLQKVGRDEITLITARHLARFGYTLVWKPGLARDLDEDEADASIICPDGSVIRAGSHLNQRTIEVATWREILAQFRGRESTWTEVEKIRRILRSVTKETELRHVVSFAGIGRDTSLEIDQAFALAEVVTQLRYPRPRSDLVADDIRRLRDRLTAICPEIPQDEHDDLAWNLQISQLTRELHDINSAPPKTKPPSRTDLRILTHHQLIRRDPNDQADQVTGSQRKPSRQRHRLTDRGRQVLGADDPSRALGLLLLAAGVVRGSGAVAPELLPGAAGRPDAPPAGGHLGAGPRLGFEASGHGPDHHDGGGPEGSGRLRRGDVPRSPGEPGGLRGDGGLDPDQNGQGSGRRRLPGGRGAAVGPGPGGVLPGDQLRAPASDDPADRVTGGAPSLDHGPGPSDWPAQGRRPEEGPRGPGWAPWPAVRGGEGGGDPHREERDHAVDGAGRREDDLGPLALPRAPHRAAVRRTAGEGSREGGPAGGDLSGQSGRFGVPHPKAVPAEENRGHEADPPRNGASGDPGGGAHPRADGGAPPPGVQHAVPGGLVQPAQRHGQALPARPQSTVLGPAALTHRVGPVNDRFQRNGGMSPMHYFGAHPGPSRSAPPRQAGPRIGPSIQKPQTHTLAQRRGRK